MEPAAPMLLMEWTRGFLPPEWQGAKGRVVLVLYRTVRAPVDTFGAEPLACLIGSVWTCLFWGSPMVPKASSEFWFVEPKLMGWNCNLQGDEAQQEGRYCLLYARFADQASKAGAKAAIDAACGFLYAYHGRNVAYMKLCELEMSLETDEYSQSTETVENPLVLPAPRLLAPEFEIFREAARLIGEADEPDRDRLSLSLRWFSSATHLWGPDAFLHYWIALEALAMPDSTNIRPIGEHLASTYQVSHDEAKKEFRVGRLYGFRGAVVHDGSHIAVPGEVLTYLAALYADVLLSVLSLPPEGWARSAWKQHGEVVDRFLEAAF